MGNRMALPTFHCPVCRNPLTLDVVFAHDGVRDSIVQLVKAHPEGRRLLQPLLAYVGMFAPVKTEMRYARVAAILADLVSRIKEGTVRDEEGAVRAAPLDYWRQAFEEMVAKRDAGFLKLPLKSHGYLFAVVAGLTDKAAASAERQTEAQRAGHAGTGTAAGRKTTAVTVSEPGRTGMPADIRKSLLSAVNSRRAETPEEQ